MFDQIEIHFLKPLVFFHELFMSGPPWNYRHAAKMTKQKAKQGCFKFKHILILPETTTKKNPKHDFKVTQYKYKNRIIYK